MQANNLLTATKFSTLFIMIFPIALLFILITIIELPNYLVLPPQYSCLYDANMYDTSICLKRGPSLLMISKQIINNKLYIAYKNCDTCDDQPKKIFRFDAAQQKSKQIFYNIVKEIPSANGWRQLEIPELQEYKLSNKLRSPDGYIFKIINKHYKDPVLLSLFLSLETKAVLKKNQRYINLDAAIASNIGYFVNNIEFLGWIINTL